MFSRFDLLSLLPSTTIIIIMIIASNGELTLCFTLCSFNHFGFHLSNSWFPKFWIRFHFLYVISDFPSLRGIKFSFEKGLKNNSSSPSTKFFNRLSWKTNFAWINENFLLYDRISCIKFSFSSFKSQAFNFFFLFLFILLIDPVTEFVLFVNFFMH